MKNANDKELDNIRDVLYASGRFDASSQEAYDEVAKVAAAIESLLERREVEWRINELTRLDNSFDEVTPDRFHQYYIDRIAELSQHDRERSRNDS